MENRTMGEYLKESSIVGGAIKQLAESKTRNEIGQSLIISQDSPDGAEWSLNGNGGYDSARVVRELLDLNAHSILR